MIGPKLRTFAEHDARIYDLSAYRAARLDRLDVRAIVAEHNARERRRRAVREFARGCVVVAVVAAIAIWLLN